MFVNDFRNDKRPVSRVTLRAGTRSVGEGASATPGHPQSAPMSTQPRAACSGATTDGGPSPYLIGAAIGVLNIAFAALRKGIGVSGTYESSAA